MVLQNVPRVARAQPWAGISERFQRYSSHLEFSHRLGSGWAAGFSIFDCQLLYRQPPIENRKSTIGNHETHPLPRGGTDLIGPGPECCETSALVCRFVTPRNDIRTLQHYLAKLFLVKFPRLKFRQSFG